MTATLVFRPDDVALDRAAVLERLGVPRDVMLPERLTGLYDEATRLFAETAAPVGVSAELPVEEFAAVFEGEGRNAPASPLAEIYPKAERLALFAVTIGPETGRTLERLFQQQDFALAYTLDAIASVAADDAADLLERHYAESLRADGWNTADGDVLRYSPGYCGWDVTGQRKLFAHLRPERIGLTLTESCLMQPLKSVSGVVVAGPRAIHRFRPTYPFCDRCEERTCRERLRILFARREPATQSE